MHLKGLMGWIDTRGCHVCLDSNETVGGTQTAPYPAFIWHWQTIMSYPWKVPQHINVLEFLAYFNYVRKKSRSYCFHSLRFINVFDSQVAASVVAKGSSSSHRMNRPRRRLMAYELAMDIYSLGVWTLSQWQFADKASRHHSTNDAN